MNDPNRPNDPSRQMSYGVTPQALKSENAHQWSDSVIHNIENVTAQTPRNEQPPNLSQSSSTMNSGYGNTSSIPEATHGHSFSSVPGYGHSFGSGSTFSQGPSTSGTGASVTETVSQKASEAKDAMGNMYNSAANAVSNVTQQASQDTNTNFNTGSGPAIQRTSAGPPVYKSGPTATDTLSSGVSSGASAVSNTLGSAYNSAANTLSQATSSTPAHTTADTQSTSTVPNVVLVSETIAGQRLEAASEPAAVQHKHEFEDELLHTVKPTPAIHDTSRGVVGSTQGAMASARDTAGSAANSLSNTAGSAADTLSNKAGSAANTISNTAGSAANTLSNTAGSAANTISNTAGSAVNTLSNTAGAAVNALTNTAGAAVSSLTNAFQNTSLTGTGTTPSTVDHSQSTTSTVPVVVRESQMRASESPEASAIPSAVRHKQQFENELLGDVNQTPAISGTTGTVSNTTANTVNQATNTAYNLAGQAKDSVKAVAASDTVQQGTAQVQGVLGSVLRGTAGVASALATQAGQSIQSMAASATNPSTQTTQATAGTSDLTQHSQSTTSVTPAVVMESQERGNVDPEASGFRSAVVQKQAVEDELLSKVDAAPVVAANSTPSSTTKLTRPSAQAMDTEATINVVKGMPGGIW